MEGEADFLMIDPCAIHWWLDVVACVNRGPKQNESAFDAVSFLRKRSWSLFSNKLHSHVGSKASPSTSTSQPA
jgi:hypothetical protein